MPVAARRSKVCCKTCVKNLDFCVLSSFRVAGSHIFRTHIFNSLPLTMRAVSFPF